MEAVPITKNCWLSLIFLSMAYWAKLQALEWATVALSPDLAISRVILAS